MEWEGHEHSISPARFVYYVTMVTKFIVDILVVVLPLLYAGLVAVYGIAFFRKNAILERIARPYMVGLLVLHVGYLGLRTLVFDHPPITTIFEIFTLLSAAMTIAYAYVEFRTNIRNTGFFILTLALIFQTVSSLFIRDLISIPEYLHSLVLGFHVAAALLGYTGISLGAVYGSLYLMLYHEIKSSRFGIIYTRLPNLETLEGLSHKAEVFGFVALSVAIAIGLLWLPRVFSNFSLWDPKLVGTIAIWVLYAIVLMAKRRFGWQGRKTMVLSLIGFAFMFLSMTIINMYLSTFHTFH
jgi:ABC-type uncharacterized transport system permease subunit